MNSVIIKQLEAFNSNVFNLTKDVKYPIIFQDTYTVFIEDNNGTRVGIAKYANPLVVEIINANDEIVNEPFPTVEV